MSSDRHLCLDFADDLTAVVDDQSLPPAARHHVAECLRCQAEVAQYRRLARAMRDLAGVRVAAPPDLELGILVALDREPERLRRRMRTRGAAAVGGIAAAAGANQIRIFALR